MEEGKGGTRGERKKAQKGSWAEREGKARETGKGKKKRGTGVTEGKRKGKREDRKGVGRFCDAGEGEWKEN